VVGAGRTAEELGRAFASTPVVTSGGSTVIADVSSRPALVIATPGAEPVAENGYVAALLLDTWALLGRADLRASEETLRRWMAAAALVRPAAAGGQVVVVGDSSLRPVQALVRWDPVGHASRELEDRTAVGLPPAVRIGVVAGTAGAVADLMDRVELPSTAVVLGPSAIDHDNVRAVIRVPRSAGLALASALRRAAGERSARKAPDAVNIRMDPHDLT
jgi:primosomal protein N' (replication factor Y)